MAVVTAVSLYYDRDEAVIATDEGSYILTIRDVKELAIKRGDELDGDKLEQVEQRDENLKCLKKLLGAVARTNISKKRLKYKYKNDFSEEALDFAVKKLESVGYVNDSEFAKRQAQLLAKKPYGKSRIKSELRAKGFESEDIEAAIEELEAEGGDNSEIILMLLEKRYRSKEFDKAKAYVFLRSKGYEGDEIRAAINSYLENNGCFDDEITTD